MTSVIVFHDQAEHFSEQIESYSFSSALTDDAHLNACQKKGS